MGEVRSDASAHLSQDLLTQQRINRSGAVCDALR